MKGCAQNKPRVVLFVINAQDPTVLGMKAGLESALQPGGFRLQVVFFHAVFDENVLSKLFQQSLLCISPHQAGLSVLKSFAYGTPFVTRQDAITGGELYNIRNGENGVLYRDDADLALILSDAASHPEKYLEMGRAAHRFYAEEASPEAMAGGILAAIHYALDHPK